MPTRKPPRWAEPIMRNQRIIMSKLDDLLAQGARVVTAVGALQTTVSSESDTIKANAATIKDLTDKLAAMPAPGTSPEDDKKIEDLTSQLKAAADGVLGSADAVVSAVTPVADAAAPLATPQGQDGQK